MLSKIGHYSFTAQPFHCDSGGRLAWHHLGNDLINAADLHSNQRQFGITHLTTIDKTWVLSRLAIELTDRPAAYTPFTIDTWVESVMRSFTNRSFLIAAHNPGEAAPRVYGHARSVWALIDTQTRQPADLNEIHDGLINSYVEPHALNPMAPFTRVRLTPDAPLVGTHDATYSDVDVNGHVNSICYLQHVIDLWPLDWHRDHPLRRIEAAYVAESHYGDRLLFRRHDSQPLDSAVSVSRHDSRHPDTPVEVCRFRLLFG